MDQEYRREIALDEPPAESETVWQWYDETAPRITDDQREPHWSNQMTQPLLPQWPFEPSMAAQASAMNPISMLADWRKLAMRVALRCGAVAILSLSLLLLVTLASGLLAGSGASAESERVVQPASVQSTLTPIHATSHQPAWSQPHIGQPGKHHHKGR